MRMCVWLTRQADEGARYNFASLYYSSSQRGNMAQNNLPAEGKILFIMYKFMLTLQLSI